MNYMTIQLVAHRTMLHVIKILPIKLLAPQTPLSSTSNLHLHHVQNCDAFCERTSGYATWFMAGGAIRIAHYDVIDDVITRKL